MASRRTKSIGTKVTPEEYARIQTVAGDQPVSEWVRAALLKAAEAPAADAAVLAELLALRAILLNLHFHLCSGAPVTAETMQRLIERADQDKGRLAEARFAGDGAALSALPAAPDRTSHKGVLLVGMTSHAGESRRGEAGNRGCSAHPFGGSRNNAEKRAGSAAFTRTGPKTAATPVVSRRTLGDALGDSRRIHGSRTVARGAPLHGAWRSHRPPMRGAIPLLVSSTGSSGSISRPSAPKPPRSGMATGCRSLSSKSFVTSCGAAAWPEASLAFGGGARRAAGHAVRRAARARGPRRGRGGLGPVVGGGAGPGGGGGRVGRRAWPWGRERVRASAGAATQRKTSRRPRWGPVTRAWTGSICTPDSWFEPATAIGWSACAATRCARPWPRSGCTGPVTVRSG
jgi:hypothetical protein